MKFFLNIFFLRNLVWKNIKADVEVFTGISYSCDICDMLEFDICGIPQILILRLPLEISRTWNRWLRNFVKTMQLGWERFLQVGDQEERVRERMEEERERARQYRWSHQGLYHISICIVFMHCWEEECVGQLGFSSFRTEKFVEYDAV